MPALKLTLGLLSLVLLNACALPISHVPSSRNTVSGSAENYICPLADGSFELKLAETTMPSCIKLSELPPEDAQQIETAAAEQDSTIIAPGSLHIESLGIGKP